MPMLKIICGIHNNWEFYRTPIDLNHFLMLPPLEDETDLDSDHNDWAVDALRRKL